MKINNLILKIIACIKFNKIEILLKKIINIIKKFSYSKNTSNSSSKHNKYLSINNETYIKN